MGKIVIALAKVIELLTALDGKFVGKLIITYGVGGIIVDIERREKLFK